MIIDKDIILELKDALEEEFASLIDDFVKSIEREIADIESAIQADDFTQVLAVAHSAKGSSANTGAIKLSEDFNALESAIKLEPNLDCSELLKLIHITFEQTRAELSKITL